MSSLLCERLGIADQIDKMNVLREFGQAVQIDPKSYEILETVPRRELGAFVHAERRVDDIPVWSSHLVFGLTARQVIGFLEFHWPDIPNSAIREAGRMAHMIAKGWRAPDQPVAAVESVEAGIVHTPGVGYFFDVHAAIRVIYRSLDRQIGRKPTYYVDRHGEPVKLRRISELIREPSRSELSPSRSDPIRADPTQAEPSQSYTP